MMPLLCKSCRVSALYQVPGEICSIRMDIVQVLQRQC